MICLFIILFSNFHYFSPCSSCTFYCPFLTFCFYHAICSSIKSNCLFSHNPLTREHGGNYRRLFTNLACSKGGGDRIFGKSRFARKTSWLPLVIGSESGCQHLIGKKMSSR